MSPGLDFLREAMSRKTDDCIEWPYSKDKDGYGRLVALGERRAHRAMYRLAKGEIPQSILVMHGCDNPSCVNSRHLTLGTHAENMQDMWRKGRAKQFTGIAKVVDNRGERHAKAKLSESNVLAIREEHRCGNVTLTELALKHEVSRQTVSEIVSRITWRHI